jgi:hypothetical protein
MNLTAGVTTIGDDEFDSFLTYLEIPTTTNVQIKVPESDVDDVLAVPYAAEEMNAEEEETMSVTTTVTTKSDNEFDDFLTYLGGEELSKEVDDSIDEFLSYLNGDGVVLCT